MTDVELVEIFSKPQYGGDLPYFSGNQYGNGAVLNLVKKMAFPLLKKAGKHLGNLALNTVSDTITGNKSVGESLKSNAIEEVKSVASDVGNLLFKRPPDSPSEASINKQKKTSNVSSKGTIFS